MAHDVFICYSSRDKAIADAICRRAEERGIRCWIAPRDAGLGADYADSLSDALANSKALALVFSRHADASDHVRSEVHAAFDSRGRTRIFTLRIEDVEPSRGMSLFTKRFHWIDALSEPRQLQIDKFCDSIASHLQTCGVQISPTPTHDTGKHVRPATASSWRWAAAIVVLTAALVSFAYVRLTPADEPAPSKQSTIAGEPKNESMTVGPATSPPPEPPPVVPHPQPLSTDPTPVGAPQHIAAKERAIKAAAVMDWDTAFPAFDAAEASLRQRVAEEKDNAILRREFADVLTKDGYQSFWIAGNRKRGLDRLEEALKVTEQLKPPSNDDSRWAIWQVEQNLAAMLRASGEKVRAKSVLQSAWDVSQSISASPGINAGYNSAAVGTLKTLGEWALHDGEYAHAKTYYGRALGQADAIVATNPSDQWALNEQAAAQKLLGDVYAAQKDYTTALTHYKSAVEIGKKLVPGRRWWYWSPQTDVGVTLRNLDRKREAAEAFEAAKAVADAMPGEWGLDTGLNTLAIQSRRTIAENAVSDGDIDAAVQAYDDAARVGYEILVKRPKAIDVRADTAEVLRRSGLYRFWNLEQQSRGLELLAKADVEARNLGREDRVVVWNARSDLAFALHKLGDAKQAASLYEEARRLADKLPGDYGLALGRNASAITTYKQLGALMSETASGNPRSAFEHARDTARQMLDKAPDNTWVKNELAAIENLLSALPKPQ